MDDMARTLGTVMAEVIIAFILAQRKKEQDYIANKEMIEQEERKMQEKTYRDVIDKLHEDVDKYFSGDERDRLHDQLDVVEKKLQEEGELDAVFNRNHKYFPEITYEYAQRMEAFENKIFQQWLHEIITPEETMLEKEKKLDRDRDGLTDDQERRRGTDPTMIDTDRDGKPDPEEERYGAEQEIEMEG